MKVIEGNFNGEACHAGERLREQLEKSGLLDQEKGEYVLFFDQRDSIYVLTNSDGPGDVLLTMEKGKQALMASVYEHDTGGDTA